MFFKALLLLLSGARALRFGTKSPGQVYNELIFQDRINVLLHTMKLTSSLTDLLNHPSWPFRKIYDIGCRKYLTVERYKEISDFCTKNPVLWGTLASPDCLANSKDDTILRSWNHIKVYPYSTFLSKDFEPPGTSASIKNLEVYKITRMPLIQIDTCLWIRRGFAGIDFDRPNDLASAVWELLHPRCIEEAAGIEDDNYDVYLHVFKFINREIPGGRGEQARHAIKLFNILCIAKRERRWDFYAVILEIISVFTTSLIYLDKRPEWLVDYLSILPMFDGPSSITFNYKRFIKAILLGVSELIWKHHWMIQLAEMYANVHGQLSPDIEAMLELAMLNGQLWPLDLLSIYHIQKSHRELPSPGLMNLAGASRLNTLQTHLMSNANYYLSRPFDTLLISKIPGNMRLKHIRETDGILNYWSVLPDNRWASKHLRKMMFRFEEGSSIKALVWRIFISLTWNDTIKMIRNPETGRDEALVQINDSQSMQCVGSVISLSILYGLKLPVRLVDFDQVLLMTSHTTAKQSLDGIKGFESFAPRWLNKRGLNETKVDMALDAMHSLRTIVQVFVSYVKLLQDHEIYNILQPLA